MRTKIAMALAFAGLAVSTLAGCAEGPPQAPQPKASAPTRATNVPAPPTEPVTAAEEPDPCEQWSGNQIASSLSEQDYGPASPVFEADPEFSCEWALPEELRSELGMDPHTGSKADVLINLFPYGMDMSLEEDGSQVVAGPEDLPSLNASGTRGTWTPLPGNPPAAIGAGPQVQVQTKGETWFELSLYLCSRETCGDQAIKAARALSGE